MLRKRRSPRRRRRHDKADRALHSIKSTQAKACATLTRSAICLRDDVEAGSGGGRLGHADGGRKRAWGAARILAGDVVVDKLLEGDGEFVVRAFQGDEFFAVDVDRAAWFFASAGEADADVSGAGFARAVDDAAHHGELQFLDTFEFRFPLGHSVANVLLDALSQFLKRGACGAAAAGTCGDAGRERAQAEGLEQFAGGVDFVATVAARARSERDANRVADAFAEKNRHGRRGPDETFGAHTSFRQS